MEDEGKHERRIKKVIISRMKAKVKKKGDVKKKKEQKKEWRRDRTRKVNKGWKLV